ALYDGLAGLDQRLHEAAASLGASRVRRFFAVTLPLSLPALRAGTTIVFLMASTAYVSATLLGGRMVRVVGMDVWSEALQNLQMPLASALAVVMLVCGVVVTLALAAFFGQLTPWTSTRPEGRRERALVPEPLVRMAVRFGD